MSVLAGPYRWLRWRFWFCACFTVVLASPARSTQSKGVAATKVSSEKKLVASLIALLEAGTTPGDGSGMVTLAATT